MKEEEGTKRRDLPERTFEFARRVVKLCQTLDQKPGINDLPESDAKSLYGGKGLA